MNNQPQKFYTGALPDPIDIRDYKYNDIIASAGEPIVIDWKKGFDIRNVLGDHIDWKNQMSSSSCVGQGMAYYVFVKQVKEMMKKYNMDLAQLRKEHPKEVEEASAKAIYSQIFLKQSGGAYVRSAFALVKNWGALFESQVPSWRGGLLVDEEFMRDRSWKTPDMDEFAKTFQALSYTVIDANDDIDLFAHAIQNNDGVVGGLYGQNGKNWHTVYPLPPEIIEWAHCLFFGAFGIDEEMKTPENPEGKFVATPNSWGNSYVPDKSYKWKKGDPIGEGWQKIPLNYFKREFMFNPRTYVDKQNVVLPENTMFDTIKLTNPNNPEIYAVAPDGSGDIYWIGGWQSYVKLLNKKFCNPYKEVDSLAGYKISEGHLGFLF